jgi:hypothetical protein
MAPLASLYVALTVALFATLSVVGQAGAQVTDEIRAAENSTVQPEGQKRCVCRVSSGYDWCAAGQLSNPGTSQYNYAAPQYTSTKEECVQLCNNAPWPNAKDIFYEEGKEEQDWLWRDNDLICPYVPGSRPATVDENTAAGISGCAQILPDKPACAQVGSTVLQYCLCAYPEDFANPFCRGKTVSMGPPHGDSGTAEERCRNICGNITGTKTALDGQRLDFKEVYVPPLATEFERCSFPYEDNCQEPRPSPTREGYQQPSVDYCKTNELHYCICAYLDTHQNVFCQGKPVKGSTVQGKDEPHCKVICEEALNLKFHSVVKSLDEVCLVSETYESCTKPVNPVSSACRKFEEDLAEAQRRRDAAILAARQAELEAAGRASFLAKGTSLGLSLPLGNISPQRFVGKVVTQLLGIMGGLALLSFVYGGVVWMTAAGNAEKMKKGRTIVVWSVLGVTAIFGAYAVLNFLFTAFGGQ